MASVRHYIQRIKEGRLKQIMGEVLWMYAYVRRYWLLIGVYILLGASGSVLGLGTSVVSKDLVDAITGVNSMEIVRVAGTYVGVGVSQIFINAVKSRLSLKVRLKVTNEIRGDIYEQVLRTNWESLAKYRSGDLLYRVNGDAGMVANTILTFLPNVVTTLISFGGAFVIVVQHDPWMALIALMGAPISFLTSRYSAKRMRDFQRENQNVASDRTVFDQETFQNLQFIKAFGMIDRVTEKFHRIQQETVDLSLKQNRFQQSMTIATSLVGQAVGYACYGFAAYRLWQGEISYGTMTMFVSMAGSLRGSFSGILGLMPMVIRAGISAERIMEITSLPRDSMEDKEEADEIRRKGQESGVYVHMEDVSFAYEEEDWIYQDASFRAEPGEIVALIGPSGQGKTTTLNLLLGLYHPQKGGIRVGNPGGEGAEGVLLHPLPVQLHPPGEHPVFRHDRGQHAHGEAGGHGRRDPGGLGGGLRLGVRGEAGSGHGYGSAGAGHPVFRGAEAAAVHCESPSCGRAGDDPRRGHQRPGCGDGAAGAAADH